ncbi:MAG: DUF2141 domain-containing protein [Bacteroidota bacterium]
MKSTSHFVWSILLLFALSPLFAHAQDASSQATLTVAVAGISSDKGKIICALFDQADGFPMDREPALKTQAHDADPDGVTCQFDALAPSSYAISVFHDRNTNDKVDTNFLGVPKEAWGVSNGVRPRMRPPRFEEAVFDLAAGQSVTLDIEVDR